MRSVNSKARFYPRYLSFSSAENSVITLCCDGRRGHGDAADTGDKDIRLIVLLGGAGQVDLSHSKVLRLKIQRLYTLLRSHSFSTQHASMKTREFGRKSGLQTVVGVVKSRAYQIVCT